SPNQKSLEFLRLLDANGKRLAMEGGVGLHARIIYRVENTGVFQVVATCMGSGRGTFTLTVRDALEEVARQMKLLGAGHWAVMAGRLHAEAGLYEERGNHAKAELLYRQALDIRKELLGEKHPAYAASLHNLAGVHESQGNYARAEPLYRQALDIRKELLGEKH